MKQNKEKKPKGKLNNINLDNSVELKPGLFPRKGSKFERYINALVRHISSLGIISQGNRKPELDDLVLKNIITNLVEAHDRSRLVAYSRNRNFYSKNNNEPEYGIKLQYIDYEMPSRILIYFTMKSVPCLCVHDSFIVPQQYKDELVDMMKDSYRKQFKFDPVVRLNNHTPSEVWLIFINA